MTVAAPILNRDEIARLIRRKGLVRGAIDLEKQLTPNGLDLTVAEVSAYASCGALDFSNKERVLPRERSLKSRRIRRTDAFGWWTLERGAYKIKTNETLSLPNDLIAFAFPRSSLLRMGGFTQNGVWDAGFSGRSEFILVVENPHGLKLKENARVIQLVFMRIRKVKEGYSGIYAQPSRL